MTGGFQTSVSQTPAPGIAGDFASANPYFTYDAGPGGLVAGASGVSTGLFAWVTAPYDADGAGAIANNFGSGSVAGFVGRQGQPALITAFLADASTVIPTGYQMALMTGGCFWVKNDGSTTAVPGQKAYANVTTGKASFAATGAPSTATASSWSLAPETTTVVGTGSGSIFTATSVTGTYGITNGAALTGGTGPSSNTIVSQVLPLLAGEALNGIGRYYTSLSEMVAGVTYTGTAFSLLTLTTVATGNFGVGDTLSSTTPLSPLAPVITQILTGTGGSGTTAITSTSQTASSGTLSGTTNVETKWVCMTQALPGEICKIDSQPLG